MVISPQDTHKGGFAGVFVFSGWILTVLAWLNPALVDNPIQLIAIHPNELLPQSCLIIWPDDIRTERYLMDISP
jgi:hypothetical protein